MKKKKKVLFRRDSLLTTEDPQKSIWPKERLGSPSLGIIPKQPPKPHPSCWPILAWPQKELKFPQLTYILHSVHNGEEHSFYPWILWLYFLNINLHTSVFSICSQFSQYNVLFYYCFRFCWYKSFDCLKVCLQTLCSGSFKALVNIYENLTSRN